MVYVHLRGNYSCHVNIFVHMEVLYIVRLLMVRLTKGMQKISDLPEP